MEESHGIQKLTDYNHARIRTEMYLGSRAKHSQDILIYEDGKPKLKELTWVPALYTSFREILDNAIDEVAGHGYGHRIDITFDPETFTTSVTDDGRGIPIDYDSTHKEYLATMVMTHARAGRNFSDRGEVAGTNGLGAAIVNFCSETFSLEIHRDGKKFTQTFKENPLPNGSNLVKSKPVIKDSNEKTGTTVTFKPSKLVFPELKLPEEFVKSRVYEVAVANPLIRIYYNGERVKVSPLVEKSLFPGQDPIIVEFKKEGFSSKFILVPSFAESGETVHSIVNSIPAFNGGIHIETFKRLFYTGLLSALEKESKKRKIVPNRADISDGLLIYNITHMKAPDFDSQSKTRLINEWVGDVIKELINEDLFTKLVKKHRTWVDSIFERAAARTNRKDQLETQKAARSAKKTKVAGLMDASGKDRTQCILFLAEGLSAIAGMASVRNPELHGGLGLRGKVLNVNGETARKVLDNSTLVDIMNSLGLMIGEKANKEFMRYGKLYIAADMDPDGANITALLINFLHTYWPDLFNPNEEPFVYVFMTPFIIAEKDKKRKYWYAHDHHLFDPDQHKGWGITRAKGLGTLTREDWKHALVNPIAIPITDDGNVKEALDLIFNNTRADDRKVWIGL
jgi:DNA gyrase/topoisomerase IV subunit B